MKRNFSRVPPIVFLVIFLMFLMTFVSLFWNQYVFYTELAVSCVSLIVVVIYILRFNIYVKSSIKSVESNIISSNTDDLNSINRFPIPSALIGKNFDVVYANKFFVSKISKEDCIGRYITEYISNESLEKVLIGEVIELKCNDCWYSVFAIPINDVVIICFLDNTYYKETSLKYMESRPSVGIIMFDNKDEIERESAEGENSQVTALVENEIKNWVLSTSGFFKKIDGQRYMFFLEDRHIKKFIDEKFDILEKVRNIKIDERRNATISIGIGRNGSTLKECEYWARKALDMALGRGGDQAVVKQNESYSFFGGISKGIERRSKVRTRIVASNLIDQIQLSDNVLVMGHKYSDLDCIGAAIGMWSTISKSQGKQANIIINHEQTLAPSLVENIESSEKRNIFISPKKALELINDDTLLIIVDTHSSSFLESKDVYDKCHRIVVIDHHRMMVNHIEDAVIFYHESYASSASEMVSELMQYIGDKHLSRIEAEALLAGIMLDTKNFVLKTGVRTFEAAAYLRKKGADTVEVKRMFSNTIDTYKAKYQLVSGAEIFNNCAIASADDESGDIKLAAVQAADELLGIQGVEASFVVYSYNGIINISARSLGEVNVQLIMEAMGGGGHQTMAGVQLRDSTMEHAREKLVEIISSLKINNV